MVYLGNHFLVTFGYWLLYNLKNSILLCLNPLAPAGIFLCLNELGACVNVCMNFKECVFIAFRSNIWACQRNVLIVSFRFLWNLVPAAAENVFILKKKILQVVALGFILNLTYQN